MYYNRTFKIHQIVFRFKPWIRHAYSRKILMVQLEDQCLLCHKNQWLKVNDLVTLPLKILRVLYHQIIAIIGGPLTYLSSPFEKSSQNEYYIASYRFLGTYFFIHLFEKYRLFKQLLQYFNFYLINRIFVAKVFKGWETI